MLRHSETITGVEGETKGLQFCCILPKTSVKLAAASSALRCLHITTRNAKLRAYKCLQTPSFGPSHRAELFTKDTAGFCLCQFWPDHILSGHAYMAAHCRICAVGKRCPRCQPIPETQAWVSTAALVKQLSSYPLALPHLRAFVTGSKCQLTFPLSTPSGPITWSKMCFATWESTAERGSSSR